MFFFFFLGGGGMLAPQMYTPHPGPSHSFKGFRSKNTPSGPTKGVPPGPRSNSVKML